MTNPTVEAAQQYIDMGLSVLPVGADKKPFGPWGEFEVKIMDKKKAKIKFNGKGKNVAVIAGEVSGNLECLDIDDINCMEPVFAMVKAKHANILHKLVFTRSPQGYGIVYRSEKPVSGNLKLAMAWIEVDGPGDYGWNDRKEIKNGKVVPKEYTAFEYDSKWWISPTKLETRGEGGYFLVEPSKNYEILEGSFKDLEPISEIERNSILNIARTFDETPPEKAGISSNAPKERYNKEDAKPKGIPWPGDMYNKEVDFEDVLLEYGWTKLKNTHKGITFARPGLKSKIGGILYPDGNFHVFTQNAPGLEADKQYTAYSMLVHLEYDGDFKKGNQAVLDAGYHVEITPAELKEILKENPDALEDAYNRSGLSEAEVSQVATELGIPLPEGKRPGRREILYDKMDLNRVLQEVDEAIAQVHGEWGYHEFSDQLGYVTTNNTFKPYDVDTLELRAEQSMYMTQWTYEKKKPSLEPIRTPIHVLRKVLNYPNSSAPTIKGFARHPVVNSDGEVLGLFDGFQKGIMFQDCEGFSIDPRSWEECYERIVEIFCGDILFRDKDLGEALFVSMLLTGLCRLGIDGGCPGYFITANEPGTGKSTMFEFVSRTVYGKMVESVDWGTDVVERRKEIIAYLREGIECFLFDNIQQGEEVKSPILAQALTAGQFKSRIMGKGEMTFVPAQSLFVFIGNNLNMSTELSRRLLTVELLARSQNPAQRKVQVKNIAKHCEDHRAEVIGCLLKMAKEGVQMSEKIDKSSGFTFWDVVVRNPILSKTGLDIAKGFEVSADRSDETMETGSTIKLLAAVFGVGEKFTTRQVYLAIADERWLSERELVEAGKIRASCEEDCGALRDTMVSINARANMNLKVVGKILSTMADRIVGEFRFIRHKTKSKTPVMHWVELAGETSDENEG